MRKEDDETFGALRAAAESSQIFWDNAIDNETVGAQGSMLMVSATGTAVTIA